MYQVFGLQPCLVRQPELAQYAVPDTALAQACVLVVTPLHRAFTPAERATLPNEL